MFKYKRVIKLFHNSAMMIKVLVSAAHTLLGLE